MLITGMKGLTETQNRSFFSLWCMMAAPLMAGNDLRGISPSTIAILTNREAIAINQDPLGVQGRIVRREGQVQIWGAKPLFDGSQAVLVINPGTARAEVRVNWSDLGLDPSAAFFVRNLWTHETMAPRPGGLSVALAPDEAALLRLSRNSLFPLPPIIVADSYLLTFRATGAGATKLTHVLTVKTNGTDELAPWKVQPGLPLLVGRDRQPQRQDPDAHQHGFPGGTQEGPLSRHRPRRQSRTSFPPAHLGALLRR